MVANTDSPTTIAARVALRFCQLSSLRPRLLIQQALLAFDSERETGHGVDWVLAADEPLEFAVRRLVQSKPDAMLLKNGDVVFQFVIDATQQPDVHLEPGPFLVGRIICDRVDLDVRARLSEEKRIAGRHLLIYSGELA